MDPVTAIGLVAAFATLAQQALGIFTTLYKYSRSVTNAPRRAMILQDEILILAEVLADLEPSFNTNPTWLRGEMEILFERAVHDCKSTLDAIGANLEFKHGNVIKALKWPFAEKENDMYLSKIERFKNLLNLIMNIEQRLYLRLPN
jgi:hypothetical protein